MSDLEPTLSRLKLLLNAKHSRIRQHPDGDSRFVGDTASVVTAQMDELERAGWVFLEDECECDVRYWRLTDAGQAVLDAAGGAR